MKRTAARAANTIFTSKQAHRWRETRLTIFPAKITKDDNFAVKPGEEYRPHERHRHVTDGDYGGPLALRVLKV